jgi:hypothetical protein
LLKDLAPVEAVKIDIPHIGAHIWDGKGLLFNGNRP